MNRLSPAHACLAHTTHSVDGMPAVLRVGATPPTWLADLSPLRRWLVRGGEAAAWLAARDLPIPEQLFRAHDLGADAFLVRTGRAEFFLHDGPGGALRAKLGEIPDGLVAGMRIVVRDDLEVALGGAGADRLMREFCALDLAEVENQFLFTRVAGTTAWLRVEGEGGRRCYRIGCDPSYGEYLFETLLEGVHECAGDITGYADFYDSRGIAHDAS
jgi:sarcosine oxidase subunit gamma